MSVIRQSSEKIGISVQVWSLKVLVKAIAKSNPEYIEKGCNSNYAKTKASRSTSYIPHNYYECMASENLVSSKLVFRKANRGRKERYIQE